jgi:hypothetical protein
MWYLVKVTELRVLRLEEIFATLSAILSRKETVRKSHALAAPASLMMRDNLRSFFTRRLAQLG